MTGSGLYIHIPFCRKKCDYCDFASIPMDPAADDNVGAGGRQPLHDYLVAINNELQSYPAFIPSTIFIGGGTPTILNPDELHKLMDIVEARGRVPLQIEFTIESNPGTVDAHKLKLLHYLGINRLSIGAQSFNDDELKILGRIHNSKQIINAFENARNAGFDNINIDLIFGIPGQTLGSLKETLDAAIKLNPEHISCYGLQIEEGTPFWGRYVGDAHDSVQTPHAASLSDDDLQYHMYKHTIDLLKSRGYHHYEISNFAKPGYECKHNINYWKNGDYLGIGASAASHIDGKRWENTTNIDEYICKCGSRTAFINPATARDGGTPKIEITETILMNLRLLEGIDLKEFENRFGASIHSLYGCQLGDLTLNGLVEIKSGLLRLTEKGLYLGNIVFESFV